ncbi:hypothetical protein CsSME_00005002 [Camellia sinensis var. sinensis]
MRQLTGANWHDLMVWSIGTTSNKLEVLVPKLEVKILLRSLTPKPDLFKPLVIIRHLHSSVRKTTSITLLYFRRSSSVKVFSLLNLACYILLVLVASFVLHQSKDLKDLLWQRKKHLKLIIERYAAHYVSSFSVPLTCLRLFRGKARRRDIQAYSDLPKTAFGMRASSAIREPEIQKLWDENQMFKRVSDRNNGLLRNYKFRDVPGWDCHGQPIELKGKLIEIKEDELHTSSWDHDARKELTPLKLRAKAAKFAKATIKTHMASFKQFGRWGDWDHPYLTLDLDYDAAQSCLAVVSSAPFPLRYVWIE